MTEEEQKAWQRVRDLLDSQRLAAVATDRTGHPYCSLVAFAVVDDLKRILFATPRATRKFRNLQSNPKVALLIDNRKNRETDLHESAAVTAIGTAREIEEKGNEYFFEAYIRKHPALEGFVRSPTCAFICVEIDRYYYVSRFQHVVELRTNR